VERAKKPKRLPVDFTREEARAVLGHFREEAWLMASLLYGSGLRLMECVRFSARRSRTWKRADTVTGATAAVMKKCKDVG
jgi:integrase